MNPTSPFSAIETLESRIAPASLSIDHRTVIYTDGDGDSVTLTVTKGDLTGRVNFDTATFGDAGPQNLLSINLKSKSFKQSDVTITAVQAGGGDGFANLGFLDAKKVDLGNVNIDGDLAKIVAGDKKTGTAGLGDLTLRSLAVIGPSTGAPNPYSTIKGAVGDVNISGDVSGQIAVVGGAKGDIASLTVGGSLVGLPADDFTGNIFCTGDMGAALISGSILGSAAQESGALIVIGTLTSLQVNGNLAGGIGRASGSIFVGKDAGPITIGGNVTGSDGRSSGQIDVARVDSVTITGGLTGGVGDQSGNIFLFRDAGAIHLGLNLEGGSGSDSGLIFGNGTISEVDIDGSVIGSIGSHSGTIRADGDLTLVTITGPVSSGTGLGSGSIFSGHNIGTLTLQSSVTGTAANPVFITALGQFRPHGTANISIDSVTITGAAQFLNIEAGYDVFGKAKNADAQIDNVHFLSTVSGTNIVAGAKAGADTVFGTADDVKIKKGVGSVLAKILQVTIDAAAVATVAGTDHFGIVAEQVEAVSANASAVSLTSGPHNDHGVQVGTALDYSVEEV